MGCGKQSSTQPQPSTASQRTCHSRFLQTLYGTASPYRLRMFKLSRTHASAWCASLPEQCALMVESNPSNAGAGAVKCGLDFGLSGPPSGLPRDPSFPVYQLPAR